MLVLDSLEMLTGGDSLAELEAALSQAAARLRHACAQHDTGAAERLRAWIDHRLDQRLEFASGASR